MSRFVLEHWSTFYSPVRTPPTRQVIDLLSVCERQWMHWKQLHCCFLRLLHRLNRGRGLGAACQPFITALCSQAALMHQETETDRETVTMTAPTEVSVQQLPTGPSCREDISVTGQFTWGASAPAHCRGVGVFSDSTAAETGSRRAQSGLSQPETEPGHGGQSTAVFKRLSLVLFTSGTRHKVASKTRKDASYQI